MAKVLRKFQVSFVKSFIKRAVKFWKNQVVSLILRKREPKRATRTPKKLPVAQLDRATDSDSVGRKFESCRVDQKIRRHFAVFHFFVR